MADFERRQFEIELEFMRWSFAERNNFSEGSSKPRKDAQVIRVRGAAAPRVFELELLVQLPIIIIILISYVYYTMNIHTVYNVLYGVYLLGRRYIKLKKRIVIV